MKDLVVHILDGIFGEEQQQIALHFMVPDPVVDFDGQCALPAMLIGVDQIRNGAVLAQHHRMSLGEGGIQLIGKTAQLRAMLT
mgnify:CR=1 FL=1